MLFIVYVLLGLTVHATSTTGAVSAKLAAGFYLAAEQSVNHEWTGQEISQQINGYFPRQELRIDPNVRVKISAVKFAPDRVEGRIDGRPFSLKWDAQRETLTSQGITLSARVQDFAVARKVFEAWAAKDGVAGIFDLIVPKANAAAPVGLAWLGYAVFTWAAVDVFLPRPERKPKKRLKDRSPLEVVLDWMADFNSVCESDMRKGVPFARSRASQAYANVEADMRPFVNGYEACNKHVVAMEDLGGPTRLTASVCHAGDDVRQCYDRYRNKRDLEKPSVSAEVKK